MGRTTASKYDDAIIHSCTRTVGLVQRSLFVQPSIYTNHHSNQISGLSGLNVLGHLGVYSVDADFAYYYS